MNFYDLSTPNVRVQIPEKHNNFQNHFEYFSATLSQVCIQHDELEDD